MFIYLTDATEPNLNDNDRNTKLDEIVKEIIIQIVDTNFINQVGKAKNWV